MNKIKWGIIGCGDVTEIKSGPGFQKAPGSELIAVMRRTPDLARDYATRHNVPKWYSTTEALIADPDVDAVYIATPPGSHCEIARAVAQAKKPCYVEKPMARNTTECEIMLNAFTEAKQKLWVAYYRRAMPRFLKVKDLIDTQVIGKIVAIEFSFSSPTPQNADSTKHAWRVSAQHSGGGLLLDVGSHVLDILDFYFGALKEVKGISYRQNKLSLVEDYVEMTFFNAENIPGKASWNFYSEIKEDKLTLKGTKGEIYFAFGSDDPICVNTPLGLQSFNIPNPTHVAQPLIELITNELLGLGNAPSTGSSALRTQRVIDQVLTGFYGNRAVDFWNNTTTWPGLS